MEALNVYDTKIVEYLLAVLSLVLFVPFWRYVDGARPARAAARVPKPAAAEGWFSLPGDVRVHPGHAWVRSLGGELQVGLDDFAHRLVGPLTGLTLPAPGTQVVQGEPSFLLHAADGAVPVLGPVDGTVVAVNTKAVHHPELVHRDPYGEGWLFAVQPRNVAASARHLLSGTPARRWLDGIAESLREQLSPAVPVLQDGGSPVMGLAREVAGAQWESFACRLLLTLPEPAPPPAGGGRAAATAILVAALALGAGAAAVAGSRLPRLPADHAFTQAPDSPGPVTFSHATHVDEAQPSCAPCHPRLFRMLRAGTPAAGARPLHLACGACHDGTSARQMDDCQACHR